MTSSYPSGKSIIGDLTSCSSNRDWVVRKKAQYDVDEIISLIANTIKKLNKPASEHYKSYRSSVQYRTYQNRIQQNSMREEGWTGSNKLQCLKCKTKKKKKKIEKPWCIFTTVLSTLTATTGLRSIRLKTACGGERTTLRGGLFAIKSERLWRSWYAMRYSSRTFYIYCLVREHYLTWCCNEDALCCCWKPGLSLILRRATCLGEELQASLRGDHTLNWIVLG